METIEHADLIKSLESRFPLSGLFSADVRPYTSLVKFQGDEPLLAEGQTPAFLFYLIEGRAKLFLSHTNGRISLINFLDAPCWIGEMELLEGKGTACGVTAITPCVCYAIRTGACRETLLNDTVFLCRLCLFLSRKAIGNTCRYSNNQSYPFQVRLADFILTTAHGDVYRERNTEAAEYLGVTYRHLLYVLAGFVNKGVLERKKSGYHIIDREAMRNMARPLED